VCWQETALFFSKVFVNASHFKIFVRWEKKSKHRRVGNECRLTRCPFVISFLCLWSPVKMVYFFLVFSRLFVIVVSFLRLQLTVCVYALCHYCLKLEKRSEFFTLYWSQKTRRVAWRIHAVSWLCTGAGVSMLLRKQNPCLGFPDFDAEMFDYALVVFRVCHTSAGRCLQLRR